MTDHSLDTAPKWFDVSGNIGSWLKKLPTDRVVWAIIVLALGAWLLVDGKTALGLVGSATNSLVDTALFITASVLIAAYVKASGADQLIAKALSGRQEKAVLTAAVFGALSPFCSCGVVPLIAAFLAAGVPLAPVMAFWLASPVMDPEMFVLTLGVLGPEIAFAKTFAAMFLGILGGVTVMAFQRFGMLQDVLRPGISGGCGASSCGAPKVPNGKPVWAFWKEPGKSAVFVEETGTMGWFLFKWLTLAFLLEAMMIAWVPMEQVAGGLSDLGAFSVPAAALVGVPAYLNGYAAVPLVRGLMDIGLEPGAALSFMIAGGVTSIPAAIAVKALVKTPTFLLYLAIAAVGSISAGFLFMGVLALS